MPFPKRLVRVKKVEEEDKTKPKDYIPDIEAFLHKSPEGPTTKIVKPKK